MRGRDLLSEWQAAVDAVQPQHVATLERRLGVPAATLWTGMPFGLMVGTPVFGVAPIEPADDGTFIPARGGQLAVIVPTWLRGPIYATDVEDLVAFLPSNPARWWRRLGVADYLNEPAITEARGAGTPLHLLPTPLDWLRAGCPDDAAVVLDWRGAGLTLSGISRTICHTLPLAERTEAAIVRRRPEILVASNAARTAAQ